MPRDLLNRERPSRHAFDGKPPIGKNQIVGVDFQEMRSQVARLFTHLLGRLVNGDAADRGRPAAERAHPLGDDFGVAMDHVDVIHWDSEFIGDNLRERSFLSLAVR